MFVMLSVRTTTVHERQADITGKNTLTTSLNNLINLNNSIEKGIIVKTPSLNFEKDIIIKPSQQKSNFLLTELNNFKKPPPVQVKNINITN